MSTHRFKITTERHRQQWTDIIGTRPLDEIVLSHEDYMKYRAAIDAISPPVTEVRPVGRPKGSTGKHNKKKGSISLHKEDWEKLDEIGPSRGLAVKKLIEENK